MAPLPACTRLSSSLRPIRGSGHRSPRVYGIVDFVEETACAIRRRRPGDRGWVLAELTWEKRLLLHPAARASAECDAGEASDECRARRVDSALRASLRAAALRISRRCRRVAWKVRAPAIDRPVRRLLGASRDQRTTSRTMHRFVEAGAAACLVDGPTAIRDLQTADVLPLGASLSFLRNGPVLGLAREGEHLVLLIDVALAGGATAGPRHSWAATAATHGVKPRCRRRDFCLHNAPHGGGLTMTKYGFRTDCL